MTKAISIFSCANELHKIAIKRWRIAEERALLEPVENFQQNESHSPVVGATRTRL